MVAGYIVQFGDRLQQFKEPLFICGNVDLTVVKIDGKGILEGGDRCLAVEQRLGRRILEWHPLRLDSKG